MIKGLTVIVIGQHQTDCEEGGGARGTHQLAIGVECVEGHRSLAHVVQSLRYPDEHLRGLKWEESD
jgi:hypothetical protein